MDEDEDTSFASAQLMAWGVYRYALVDLRLKNIQPFPVQTQGTPEIQRKLRTRHILLQVIHD
jgi:hypothetical protein